MLPVRKILHPMDFSDCSHGAFAIACCLARDYGARLVLLCVVEPSLAFGDGAVSIPVQCDLNTFRGMLDEIKPPDATIPVERKVLGGDAAQEILRVAREQHCDLIVMGTHGRSGLGRVLMGSVAENVVRHATCPVLTVKGGHAPATSANSQNTKTATAQT